jgi:DNA replicative helicase MCM subunit Mcm2 (Cdc46/Mcm family)
MGAFIRIEPLLKDAIRFGQNPQRIKFDEKAARKWEVYYNEISEDRPGLFGQITARDAPQVLRLALIYAVLDRSLLVKIQHLNAAIAVWNYSVESCRFVFGDSTDDAGADRILEALNTRPEGMTQTEISKDVFGGNRPSEQIAESLLLLQQYALVHTEKESPRNGRPITRWYAARQKVTKNELNELTPPTQADYSYHSSNSYPTQTEEDDYL